MQHYTQDRPPGATAPASRPSGKPPDRVSTEARHPRVLVVDDRPLVRRLVMDMLHDLGFPAAGAESAAEALALLGAAGNRDGGGGSAAPAVLVVGVGPGRGPDGLALAGKVARRRPAAPPPGVIYIGAHPSAPGGRALDGSARFLAEPFGLGALGQAAHEVLGWPVPRWLLRR